MFWIIVNFQLVIKSIIQLKNKYDLNRCMSYIDTKDIFKHILFHKIINYLKRKKCKENKNSKPFSHIRHFKFHFQVCGECSTDKRYFSFYLEGCFFFPAFARNKKVRCMGTYSKNFLEKVKDLQFTFCMGNTFLLKV